MLVCVLLSTGLGVGTGIAAIETRRTNSSFADDLVDRFESDGLLSNLGSFLALTITLFLADCMRRNAAVLGKYDVLRQRAISSAALLRSFKKNDDEISTSINLINKCMRLQLNAILENVLDSNKNSPILSDIKNTFKEIKLNERLPFITKMEIVIQRTQLVVLNDNQKYMFADTRLAFQTALADFRSARLYKLPYSFHMILILLLLLYTYLVCLLNLTAEYTFDNLVVAGVLGLFSWGILLVAERYEAPLTKPHLFQFTSQPYRGKQGKTLALRTGTVLTNTTLGLTGRGSKKKEDASNAENFDDEDLLAEEIDEFDEFDEF